ncbi:MAG: dockerin type I repeat-containing protein, partial [candidate division Zixibacteria bacterium]|nr:dockerin type I repeat-containing protein [candidate division Zixibacteria bacterium]
FPAEIVLGDIPHDGTVDNSATPFLVEIPAEYAGRTDSFYLDLTWNDGAGHDRLSFALTVGQVPILLVDDDAGGNREKYYTEYLNQQRIPYRLWTSPPAPTAVDLALFDIVIWYTGDYRTTPLDLTKVAAMEGYLDGGGQLLLTGQGIAAQLSGLDPVFLSDYLKAQYLSTKNIPVMASMPGATLFTPADTAAIAGYGGAGNQTREDQITAVNGGIPELQYLGDSGLGCISWWDSYKLVFMSFGFEAMVNGDSRWVYRDTVYERILSQFQCPRPSNPMTVSVTPGEAMNLVDHFPTIAWTYGDGLPHPQQMYQVQVGTDNDWDVAEMWASGPVTSSDTASPYAGAPLVDGQEYFIRVQVFDGAVWSNWHYRQMRMNSRPGQPSNLNPDNLTSIPNDALNLTHDCVYDPDGDLVTYAYEVYDDPEMTQLAVTASDIPAGIGTTVLWRIPGSLTAGEDYYWRVCADDKYERSDWSALASFTVTGDFMCGDANGDGKINVGDAVFIISYIFRSGPPPEPFSAGDANGDSKINIGDAVYIVTYVFRGGPAPVCP